MSLRAKSINALFWSGLQSWGYQFISLIVVSVLAILLSPQDFGIVTLAMVQVAFAELFMGQGFSTAIIQRKNITEQLLNSAFWSTLLVGILLAIILAVAANPISVIFKQHELKMVLQVLSLVVVLNSISSIHRAIMRKNLLFKPLAYSSIIAAVVGGFAGICCAMLGFGVWSLVVQQVVNSFVSAVLQWYSISWRPKFEFSKSAFLDLYSFGIFVVGVNIVEFANRHILSLLIGFFLGPIALGYYGLAHRISGTFVKLLSGPVNQVALSSFSKLQSDKVKLKNTFSIAIEFLFLATIPLCIIAIYCTPTVITNIFGEKWEVTVGVLQVLFVAGAVEIFLQVYGSLLLAIGRPNWKFKLETCGLILGLILFFISVDWGIIAVAVSYLIRTIVLIPAVVYLVGKEINISFIEILRLIRVPVTAALLMLMPLYIFSFNGQIGESNLIQSIARLVISILLYVFVIIIFYQSKLTALVSVFFEGKNVSK